MTKRIQRCQWRWARWRWCSFFRAAAAATTRQSRAPPARSQHGHARERPARPARRAKPAPRAAPARPEAAVVVNSPPSASLPASSAVDQGRRVHRDRSAVLLQDLRSREVGREGRDLHDRRHVRRDVRLHVQPGQGLRLLQDPGRGQHRCPAGVTPQGSMDCGPSRSAWLCNSLRAPSAASTSTRRAPPRSAGASARRRTRRAAHVELRQRHGVAVPARPGC